MAKLSLDEVELIQRITRDATGGGTFRERMTDMASTLSVLVPAGSITTMILGADGIPTHASYWNGDESTLVQYATHYRHHDPMGAGIAAATGLPLLLSDCLEPRAFGRDPFTSDLLGPLGMRWVMGVAQSVGAQGKVAVAIQREKALGDFTARERDFLRLVTPDLTRAAFGCSLVDRFAAAPQIPAAGPGAGALLLDGQGELVHADPRGLELLGRLLAEDASALQQLGTLARAPRPALVGACVLRPRDGGFLRVRYSLLDRPDERRLLVVIEDLPAGSPERFEAAAEQAGFTGREREVALLVLEGEGNRGIGHRLGMSESTVKFHLGNVFKKTGVPGRTELIHALLGTHR